MTNIELHLATANKALDLNLLDEGEKKFIQSIADYDKKQLRGLTTNQSGWLVKISRKYEKRIND